MREHCMNPDLKPIECGTSQCFYWYETLHTVSHRTEFGTVLTLLGCYLLVILPKQGSILTLWSWFSGLSSVYWDWMRKGLPCTSTPNRKISTASWHLITYSNNFSGYTILVHRDGSCAQAGGHVAAASRASMTVSDFSLKWYTSQM